jgi:hypothetical protein
MARCAVRGGRPQGPLRLCERVSNMGHLNFIVPSELYFCSIQNGGIRKELSFENGVKI